MAKKAQSSRLVRSLALTFVAFQCALVLYQIISGTHVNTETQVVEYSPDITDTKFPKVHSSNQVIKSTAAVAKGNGSKKKKVRLKPTQAVYQDKITLSETIHNTSILLKTDKPVSNKLPSDKVISDKEKSVNVSSQPKKLKPLKPVVEDNSATDNRFSVLGSNITVKIKERKAVPGDPHHVYYLEEEPLAGTMPNDIMRWMDRSGARCRDDSTGKLCPCVPPGLKGKMSIDFARAMTYTWEEALITAQTGNLQIGGVWKPKHCQARKNFLIVIPYRDRETHLKAFLAHMHPILQRQLISYRIIVSEQRLPVLFNKAAMMNIAYKEALRRGLGPFDCVMFHDIDVLMEDDRNMIICGDKPVHYGVYLDRSHYRKCCGMLFGGAVCLTWEQFFAVNGFSNTFFGWGGEDDNMYYRIRKMGWQKSIPRRDVGRYSTLKHTRDKGNPHNMKNYRLARVTNIEEGLSTVQYTLLDYKEQELYTWLLADVHVAGLPYPNVRSSLYYSKISGECKEGEFLYNLTATNPQHCKDSCAQDPNCSAFTYLSPIVTNKASYDCVMRGSSCTEFTQHFNYTTYIKGKDIYLDSGNTPYEAYAVDCTGHDLTNIHSESPSVCATECNKMSRCNAFVFHSSVSKCRLKFSCDPPKLTFRSSTAVAYVKVSAKKTNATAKSAS